MGSLQALELSHQRVILSVGNLGSIIVVIQRLMPAYLLTQTL
jgi:hypothetical protein